MNSLKRCFSLLHLHNYRQSSAALLDCKQYLHKDVTLDTQSTLAEVRDIIRPMNYDNASVDLHKDETNGVATITLNHQERKNAFTGRMMVDFAEAVDSLEDWSTGKGILLRGEGDTFCSGGDLRFVKEIANRDMGLKMSLLMQDTFTRLHSLSMISACLVHGNALGGGAEAILSCDFRIGCHNTAVGFVQGRLGVLTGWGGTTRLVRLVGHANALHLLSTTRLMKWKECMYIGLLNSCLAEPNEELSKEENRQKELDNAMEWLNQHLVADRHCIHLMKRSVFMASSALSLQDSLDFERRQFGDVWGGDAQLNALKKGAKHKS